MGNLLLMVVTTDSALFKCFEVAVSDAIFKIVPETRAGVLAHLRALWLSPEQIKRAPRRYWRKRARYVVLGPAQLVRDLTGKYSIFKDLTDRTRQRESLNADHKRRFEHELTYIRRGDLPDPLSIAMYPEISVKSSSACAFGVRWL